MLHERRASPAMERRVVTPQADPLDESGLYVAGQTERTQGLAKIIGRTEINVVADLSQAPTPVTFDQLSVEQSGVDNPATFALAGILNPFSKMSGQRIEVEGEAIARKDGPAGSLAPDGVRVRGRVGELTPECAGRE